ncbi:Uncharacterised protein [uncultured archaeon]|nr:Uncharacterised protein [uncultured archaeon]
MDPIKEAFTKIKEDIYYLQAELVSLKQEMSLLRSENSALSQKIGSANKALPPSNISYPTVTPTNNPTVPQEIRGFQPLKNDLSTGNKGVPTDISTYSQTNQQTDKLAIFPINNLSENPLNKMQETLESLDSIRKELRLKFKRLTPQEMLVFSTLYSLENQGLEEITYKVLATHLNLTESSIRDYTTKLLSKGIPIKKIRLNNKKIVLNVSEELKKIASLPTLIKLREL